MGRTRPEEIGRLRGWRRRERRQIQRHLRLRWRAASQPRRDGTDVVVLGFGRTGGHLLVSYLNSLPEVDVADEVLAPDSKNGLPRALLRSVAASHVRVSLHGRRSAVRGIKLRLPQVDEFGLSLSSLERQPVPLRFLLLYREDLAEQYVSQRIADRTDRWILRGDAPASNETVRVDADDAVGYFDAIRERFAQLEGDAWLRERSLWVRYEDLARSPQALFDRAITPWLGIEPAPVSAPDRRMNPKPLRAKVENWAEARGALEGPRARLAPPSGWSRATI